MYARKKVYISLVCPINEKWIMMKLDENFLRQFEGKTMRRFFRPIHEMSLRKIWKNEELHLL